MPSVSCVTQYSCVRSFVRPCQDGANLIQIGRAGHFARRLKTPLARKQLRLPACRQAAMGGFRCSRQVIFLAATASKAWEPLSVAAAGDVHYVFATALVLCEAMKLLLLLPAVLLSSARAGRAAGVSWRAAALHYGLPSLLLGVCNLGLGYAVPRLGALLYQVVFQVSTVAATGALAVALLGQRLTAGQWGALGLLTVASIGAAHSRLGGGEAHEAPPSADGLVRVRG